VASFEIHLQGADERAKEAWEFLEPVSVDIYGKPTDTILEAFKRINGSGVALRVHPQFLGGYIRASSNRALAFRKIYRNS
jgi:hypothetical protein